VIKLKKELIWKEGNKMHEYYCLVDEENNLHLVREHKDELVEEYFDVLHSRWVPFDTLMDFLRQLDDAVEYEIIKEQEAIVLMSRLMFMKFYDDGFTNE
jgi:hypothetical protein